MLLASRLCRDSTQFALDNFSEAMQFDRREKLWNYYLNKIPQLQTGVIAEFGVWKGESINFFGKIAPKPLYLDLTLFKAYKKTGATNLIERLPNQFLLNFIRCCQSYEVRTFSPRSFYGDLG
jgi:hypothetical protein